MGKVVSDMSTSLDGFIAGPNDGPDLPLGKGGERLHEWVYGLATWRERHGLGIASTRVVAVFMHMMVLKDPFVNLTGGSSYELASIYLCASILLLVLGPGKFSLDKKIFRERL